MELAKRGVPVVTITSQAFVSLREFAAKNLGVPSLPFITVPHPYGPLPREEAQRLAAIAAEEVIQTIRQLQGVAVRA